MVVSRVRVEIQLVVMEPPLEAIDKTLYRLMRQKASRSLFTGLNLKVTARDNLFPRLICGSAPRTRASAYCRSCASGLDATVSMVQ
jgi:hypothetical protein